MKIMCVEKKKIPERIVAKTIVRKENIFDLIGNSDICWIERSVAEKDVNYKQLIPYILLKNENSLFACYQRHGTETRLHGKYSAGVGGHIDEPDNQNDVVKTIEAGMYRELSEELNNFEKSYIDLKYCGIINEVESEVGLVHLGIVFVAECKNGYVPTAASELKNMEWKSAEEIGKLDKELWTELAFRLM